MQPKLKPNGIFVTQSGPAGVLSSTEVFTAINSTLHSVFPAVLPYAQHIPSYNDEWVRALPCVILAAHCLPHQLVSRLSVMSPFLVVASLIDLGRRRAGGLFLLLSGWLGSLLSYCMLHVCSLPNSLI